MKVDDVLQCSLPVWYSSFKQNTIKSILIPIPAEFIAYLNSDGIVLPKNSHHGLYSQKKTNNGDDNDDEEDSETEWSDNETEDHEKAPDFSDFDEQIKKAIATLGGAVFPKLNWSSPKDAVWVALGNTLKCTSPADIYLLLKSSDFIVHDLDKAFVLCEDGDSAPPIDFQLVLKRWHELQPSGEFRCFVKCDTLIGITQRHADVYSAHIDKESERIVHDISQFYQQVIKDKFPLDTFVFDVYRKTEGKLYLIDFNTFSPITDSIFFNWEELEDNRIMSEDLPIFRFQDANNGIQPSSFKRYTIPQDFVDLATGQDPHKLIDLLQLRARQQEIEDSD